MVQVNKTSTTVAPSINYVDALVLICDCVHHNTLDLKTVEQIKDGADFLVKDPKQRYSLEMSLREARALQASKP